MKILSQLTDTGKITEATDKKYVTDAEKTAITHSNRTVLDNLSDISGDLAYNGEVLGGNGASNLTLTVLTLGNYKISHNTVTDKLDFEYVV